MKVSQATSVNADVELHPEEAQLLLRVALMAIGRKRYSSADQILSALEHFRPEAPALVAARAVADLSRCDFSGCAQRLDAVRTRWGSLPPMLSLFRGIALEKIGNHAEAQHLFHALAAQSEDTVAARFAQDLLQTP